MTSAPAFITHLKRENYNAESACRFGLADLCITATLKKSPRSRKTCRNEHLRRDIPVAESGGTGHLSRRGRVEKRIERVVDSAQLNSPAAPLRIAGILGKVLFVFGRV
jgi:hypothetical protein